MDYEIAVASAADKQKLLEFAARNYPPGAAQRDPARWDYVHDTGRYRLWYARDESGAPLGQIATIAADCIAGGTPIEVQWICNIMVSQQARGRGIASALVRAIATEHSHCGVLGANDASIGLTASLGWRPQPDIPRYVRIVRPGYYLSRAVRRLSPRDAAIATRARHARPTQAAVSGAEIRAVDAFGDASAALAESLGGRFSLIGDRAPGELNARFLQHPVIEATALTATHGGEAAGFIVIAAVDRDGERVGFLLDWLFAPDDADAGRGLLRRACDTLVAAGVHRIEAWFEPPQMRALLEDAGLRRWPGGIQWAVDPAVAELMARPGGGCLLSRADANLHEECLLAGFAEASEYRFVTLET